MKRIALFLAVAFLVSLPTVSKAANPQAGSKCSKVGLTQIYKSKKFTCIKSGKKLIWNKGVQVVMAPTVTASTTPTPTPTPTPISTEFFEGLFEQTYDGYFADDLLFFNKEPKSFGNTKLIDIREPHDGKFQYSKKWSGYFIPDMSGIWTFSITSDDASYFWLGQKDFSKLSISNALIAIPYVHAPITKAMSIYLVKDQAYPIQMVFGNDINWAQMTFSTKAPNGFFSMNIGLYTKYHTAGLDTKDGIDSDATEIEVSSKKIQIVSNIWKDAPRDETAIAIQNIINNALSNTLNFAGKTTWFFQGETSPEVENKTKRGLLNGINFFTKLGFKTTDALVLNARDMVWLRTNLTSLNCEYGKLPDFPGFYVPRSCIGSHGAITAQHWDVDLAVGGLDGIPFNHVLSHEYFHQLQEELSGNPGNGPYPLWFWEGGAHFFSLLAYSSWNLDRNYEQWSDYWFGTAAPDQKIECINIDAFELLNSEIGKNRVCGYSKGSIIVEFYVAKFGVENYRALISRLSSNPTMGFANAFKEINNMELTTFYSIANGFLKSRGWSK